MIIMRNNKKPGTEKLNPIFYFDIWKELLHGIYGFSKSGNFS